MLTKNFLNITFFIAILFLSIGISARESKARATSSDTHVLTLQNKKSQSLVQFKSASEIKTLDDILNVDVKAFQGNCAEMFQVQDKINAFVAKLSNYSVGTMDQDLQRLQTAKSLVSEVINSLKGDTPALIQMGSNAQLQETVTLMSKLHSLSLLRGDSFEGIKNKVTKMLTSGNLETQADQANDLLSSINSIIGQVNDVRNQLFSVHEVNTLEQKRKSVTTLIQSSCGTGTGSQIVKNITKVEALPSYAADRFYVGDNAKPYFMELKGDISVNLTEKTLTEYVVGGWVRWLDFVGGAYDHSHSKDPAVIFRLFSQDRKLLSNPPKDYEDRHLFITADSEGYNFCIHDTILATVDNCQFIDTSSYKRENEWDFILFMYSYDTKQAVARVKVGGQSWINISWEKEVEQVPFNGYLGAFVGGDDSYTDSTSFNGELAAWKIWFGTNTFWASEKDAFEDSNAENIRKTHYMNYDAVPAVSKELAANKEEVSLSSGQFSLYSYYNSFIEATTYGFGIWAKVSSPGQIATLAFTLNGQIETPGTGIAQVYAKDGSLWAEVAYENARDPDSSAKNLGALPSDYFLVQVHFNDAKGTVEVFVEQNGQVTTTTFSGFDHAYVPQNVYLTVGACDVLNKQGAQMTYKTTTVYAGDSKLYGLTCDKSCLTCSGPSSSECTSCVAGLYVDNGVCAACDDSCGSCSGCGKDHCTSCKAGKVLVNGQCYCDPTCDTCSGISDSDCLSCKEHHALVNGRCMECNAACKECTDSTIAGCSSCNDGFKLQMGQCVPVCDTSVCKTCTSDGSQCTSCHDPKVLFNGECVNCDSSCKTCSGPADYQCVDCNPPAQFSCGKCIICDPSCLTCDGTTSKDCLTCDSDKELVGKECLVPCDEKAGFVRLNNNCLPCDPTCKTCSDVTSDRCTSCQDDKVLHSGHCEKPNPPETCDTTNGYVLINNECIKCDINHGYGLINEKCIKCDESCKSCYGYDPNNCIACYEPNILTNGKCKPEHPVCESKPHTYEDKDGDCVPCDSSCKECSDSTDHDCTECYDGFDLSKDNTCEPVKPTCQEEDGYVMVDGNCQPCDTSCKTCSGTSDTDCKTCFDNNVVDKDGKCSPPCDTENGNVMINGVCYPCHETCATCSGKSDTDCETCKDDLVFDNGACLPPCDTDKGFVLISRQCLPCHESCKTCKDVSNNDCTSCEAPLILEAGACIEEPIDCKPEDGLVLVNGKCIPCDKSCKTCNDISDSSCTSCESPLELSNGQCTIIPPECKVPGKIWINNNCYPCDVSCATCSGVSDRDCIDCATGRVKENGKCVEFCDVDNGFVKVGGNCLPCDKSCKTCSDETDHDCKSCFDEDFLEAGQCKPIVCVNEASMVTENKDGSCETDCDCDGTRRCSPDHTCEDCTELHNLFPSEYYTDLCPPCDKSCLYCRGSDDDECTDCDDGFYLTEDHRCKPCDNSCFRCDGPAYDDCIECDKDEILIDGVCHVPCDVDNGFFYEDPQNCLPCGRNCQTCDGVENTDCIVCVPGTEKQADGECKVPCNLNKGMFYDDQGNCVPCDDTCLRCNGPADTNCIECTTGFFLEYGRCLPTKCVDYDYKFDESIIKECNSDCECDGTRRCDPKGECEDCNVLIALYPDIYTDIVCPPCKPECHTCRGPNAEDCTTCNPGYYFDNGQCLPCDKSCATCSGGSDDECVSCDSTHVLRAGKCVEPCDEANGHFYDKDDVCTPCDDNCKTCFDTTKDSCLSCYGEDELEDNICWPPCDTKGGYTYDDKYDCVPCDPTCLTCSGTGDDKCILCPTGSSNVNDHCISCVSFLYDFDEISNPNGPSHCASDCECDNSRRCGPNGVCEDCFWLAAYFPTLFDDKDCPPCDDSCLTCHGATDHDCTTCYDGYYLGKDDACYPCDDSCVKCSGGSNKDCTECDKDEVLKDGECVVPPINCDPSCLTCSGPSAKECIECPDEHYNKDGECIPTDCINWDYDFDEDNNPMGAHRCDDDCECDGSRRCSPTKYCEECLDLVNLYPNLYDLKDCPVCDESCNTCQGPSDHDCTSCLPGFYLTTLGTCEPCDKSCALCDGGSDHDCTACISPYILTDEGTCEIPCDSTCLTCTGPSEKECKTCTADKILIDGECIVIPVCVKFDYSHDESNNILGPNRCINDCECDSTRRCSPDGYCRECMYLANLYPTLFDSKDCPECEKPCLTCNGPTDKDCTSCEDGDVLKDGECLPCDISCLTCSDVDEKSCVTCDKDLILVNGECVVPPVECDKSCKECTGPNPWECINCPDDFELKDGYCVPVNCISWDYKTDEVDGRCNNDCDCDGARRCSPDKYCQECDALSREFPSLYAPKDCPPCHSDCPTCDGPNSNDCTSCDLGYVLVDGSCEPCDKSCATCDGLTDDDCTSCPTGYVLVTTNTGAKCEVIPPPCHPTCYTCSGSTDKDCTLCYEGYQLAFDGSCHKIEECVKWGYTHDEYNNDLGSGRCADDCDCDNTRRCSPTGYCLACEDLAATYPDKYSLKDCPVCDEHCLTCDGPTDGDCTTCNDGFFFDNGHCEPCSVPHCLYCVNDADTCGKCEEGWLLDDKDGCVEPPTPCYETCLECKGPNYNDCINCPKDKELIDGECIPKKCVAFEYHFDEDSSDMGPHRCNEDCECDGTRRCSPDKYCAECVDLVYEYPNIYAFSDCPVCDKSCLSCDGPTEFDCTTCEDGYFLDKDGSCQPCDKSCATCSDGSDTGCVTCPAGFDLKKDGSCKEHIPCDPTCKECDGPNYDQCSKCDADRVLKEGRCQLLCVKFDYMFKEDPTGACTTDCDCDGTRRCSPAGVCDECSYLDYEFPNLFNSKDCPPCDDSCKTCNGPAFDNCKSCVDGKYLASDSTCQPCDKTCKLCDSGEKNGCTECYSPKVLKDGVCQEDNPKCNEPCATCWGPGEKECIDCKDHYVIEDGACVPEKCVDWDYMHNELLNKDGPYTCSEDCDCDGTRRCGPDGFCHECLDLAHQFPTVYLESDCPYCDKSCLTCKGETDKDCTSCDDGFYLSKDDECLPCDSSCLTCSEGSDTDCVTCQAPKILSAEGRCSEVTPICYDTEKCKTCVGPNPSDCVVCREGYEVSGGECKNTTECNDWDYVYDEAANPDGPYTCKGDCDCEGTRRCSPEGYCHECSTLLKTYPDLFKDCPLCDPACLTCDGPTADDCLSCKDGEYLDKDGCLPCDPICLTCSGGGKKDCITCPPGTKLEDGSCAIVNPVCNETCLECSGPLATDCTKCEEGFRLTDAHTCEEINCIDFAYKFDENNLVDGCKDDCDCSGSRRCGPSGYCESCLSLGEKYPNTYPIKDCPPCDESCEDCNGPTEHDCIECPKGLFLFRGECIDCDDSCKTCFGTAHDNCLSCIEGQVLWKDQCWTPGPNCDPTCVTCSGPGANECVSCRCDEELINGVCVLKEVKCDPSCLRCKGVNANECVACYEGQVLINGECITLNSFFGFRKADETPMKYTVSKKVSEKSDIAVGTWSKFVQSKAKTSEPLNVLFRLSGLTSEDKDLNTNDYRYSSLAVYYNLTHYTFETYTKVSGVPVLVQKSVPVNQKMENSWNLIFFGYSRANSKATGYVVFPDGSQHTVEFTEIMQDKPEENMEVYFFGDDVYNGFNGEVSSPEVLHGNNFLQTFDINNKNTYFPFKGSKQ